MAKKRTFDTAILNDIKSVAGDSFADNIKMISLEQLHDNKDNFYDLSDLDTLIEDIDRQGLKTPLYVVPDENGYTIISGHRRKAAVTELINSGKYGTDKLPCYIGSKKSEAETMLDLIMLNATSRVITDAETMKQCEKLEEVFKQLEADGKKVQGRMRDKIAAALNVSPAQVGKVENIRHNAIDEVKAAVDEGKMSISTANEVAKLKPEKQKDLIEKKKPEKITHKEVKKSVEAAKKSTSPIQKLKVINDRLENGEDVSAGEINLDETNLHTLQILQMTNVSKDDEAYEDGSEDITFDEYDRKKDGGMSHSAKMEQLSALTENKNEKIVVVDTENSYGITNPSVSEDPQLTEADIEKAKAIAELWKKPPEYFNEIIDSGMCNSIISGYVLLVLEKMGIDRPVDIFKTINSVLDFKDAQAARDKFSCN